MKKTLGLVLLLTAYGLLWPGLTQPVLSVTGFVEEADLAKFGKQILEENTQTPKLVVHMAGQLLNHLDLTGQKEVYQRTRSILGAILELQENGFRLVASLVALFSIVIPVAKGLMLAISHLPKPALSCSLRSMADQISRWSMADVFVVGIFVAFLAANAIRREGGLLSFEATLGSGFYFFLGFCLLSVLSSQMLNETTGRTAR